MLWFEITKMLISDFKHNFIVSFTIIFGVCLLVSLKLKLMGLIIRANHINSYRHFLLYFTFYGSCILVALFK